MFINPFSLQNGQTITGKDIKAWCETQITNNGSHKKEAIKLLEHYLFVDDREYILNYGPFGPGQDPCRNDNPQIRFLNSQNSNKT